MRLFACVASCAIWRMSALFQADAICIPFEQAAYMPMTSLAPDERQARHILTRGYLCVVGPALFEDRAQAAINQPGHQRLIIVAARVALLEAPTAHKDPKTSLDSQGMQLRPSLMLAAGGAGIMLAMRSLPTAVHARRRAYVKLAGTSAPGPARGAEALGVVHLERQEVRVAYRLVAAAGRRVHDLQQHQIRLCFLLKDWQQKHHPQAVATIRPPSMEA